MVSARMPVDEVNELLDAELPQGAWDTVGGLVFDLPATCPRRARRSRSTGSAWWPSGSRDGASSGCGSCRWPAGGRRPTTVSGVRAGFVAVVGRPNVGKSTLVNTMVGTKVSITSPRPNTTRHQVRGVLHRPDAQVVFVDTPGLHRPRTALGERLNERPTRTRRRRRRGGVVEATGAIGPGDRWCRHRCLGPWPGRGLPASLAARVGVRPCWWWSTRSTGPAATACSSHLATVAAAVDALDRRPAATPVAGRVLPGVGPTGEGVPALVDAMVDRLPEGPRYYPEDMVTDVPEAFWVAELVREQLLTGCATSCPTPSPAGSPSGSGPASAARSWSSATRRRAS